MTGEKLYPKKSRTYLFLISYGILAAAGGVLTAQSLTGDQSPGNAAGFMLVFGAGMFILTLIKSRKPLVLVFEDFMEVRQSRKPDLVRYRNIISVSRKGKDRLVIILREDGSRREVTVWLKELEITDIERLDVFLSGKGFKKARD
ncbi:MAG: hypothetical protein C4581_11705 [Nitrospiraceae bacterium]|nr:MAG: hypothetical protein C4581_11705 [Nitrospiraceae bacterium]